MTEGFPKHLEPLNAVATVSEKQRVIELIEGDSFIGNIDAFVNSLSKSKHPMMLSPYALSELSKMRLFKVNGFNIGFGLKEIEGKHCEIVAVHNNEPAIPGIGVTLLRAAIKHGGMYLDHFGSQKLNDLYESVGFIEIRREEYNPQYDNDGVFAARYGKLPVIYRQLKP